MAVAHLVPVFGISKKGEMTLQNQFYGTMLIDGDTASFRGTPADSMRLCGKRIKDEKAHELSINCLIELKSDYDYVKLRVTALSSEVSATADTGFELDLS